MNTDHPFLSWEAAVDWLRRQPDQGQLVSDCYYDDPLIEAAGRYWRSDEWTAVRGWLKDRSGEALDVGAGRGIASYALAKEGFAVTAMEPDTSALVGSGAIRNLAEETGLPIRVVEKYSERLPFVDDTYDVVFARAVLHHTRELDRACRELFRVLKPGGLLIAVREHVISKQADLPLFLDAHPLHRLYGGEHAYLLEQYTAALEKSGFAPLHLLSPWDSPINFAPHSLKSLKTELARQVSFGIPFIRHPAVILLDIPGVWRFAARVLSRFDRRPGRLYSFVAEKS